MFTYTKTDIICAATLLLIITRLYGWKKKDIFMKLYFWITFSSFCMVIAFAAGYLADSGIINMCRGLRSLTWACAFIAFNYTIFLWFIYSGDISGVINHIKSDELSALCDTGCHKYGYYNHRLLC